MIQIQVARRYARALFELVKDSGSLEETQAALQDIGRLLEQVPQFNEFIHNPLLDAGQRQKVLLALLRGKVPQLVENFLLYINFKDRLNFLAGMITAFDELYLSAHNRVRALVQTSLPLDEAQRNNICQKLSKMHAKEIEAQWQIRRDILGGFRIVIEGKLYDYSFTNQLENYALTTIKSG